MQIRKEKEYLTYTDFCEWGDDGQRWELVDGMPYLMASASTKHQDVSGNLIWKFREHLHGKKCKTFADLDVRLNWDKADDTVFRPDLLVICNSDKIGDSFINGAPDLIIEILSPSTKKHDITTKFVKYREAGVKELWYVDPDTQVVQVFKLEKGEYLANVYDSNEKITVGILPELTIDMKDIFETEEGEIS